METTFIENDDIYEVAVGVDPKNDMRYTVGKSYMKGTPQEVEVIEIFFDHNMLVLYGVTRVVIYAKAKNKNAKIWKNLINVPVTITARM